MVGNSETHVMHFIWPPGYDDLPEVVQTCYTTNGDLAYLAVGINVIPFCLSLVIVVILNAIICIKILRENKIGESARSKSSLTARNQVVRMLFVTSILFFILLFPFEFASISPLFDPDPAGTGAIPVEIFGAWIQYSRVLSYINSVINPIIYNAMSARYRKAFVTAFLCREAGKTEKRNTSYSTRVTSAASSVRYTHNKSVKVGDDIPIDPVSCDSIKFNTEDTVVDNYHNNDTSFNAT
uniref:Thyrotropin-releasing hormone receptor-like n=1 Tax=Saccoglossus kowalevskii TaxID=10224 RepID=A0ABM0LXH7_SACKO|nr:PREDICTED: thyrotropin-releasing hormone receptor-like [Saccoglossus kowalevskii]